MDNGKLYELYSDENHRYNTLIWQFPAAILGLNILAFAHLPPALYQTPTFLWCLFFVNLVLIWSVAKHVWHQRRFTAALSEIAKEYDNELGLCVAEFPPKHWFWKKPVSWDWVKDCLPRHCPSWDAVKGWFWTCPVTWGVVVMLFGLNCVYPLLALGLMDVPARTP